jgi:hypothetical protein
LQIFCTNQRVLNLRLIRYHSPGATDDPPNSGPVSDKLGRTTLNCGQYGHRVFLVAVLGASLLVGATTAAFAQGSPKPATERWRPKNGLYDEPGAALSKACIESDAVEIDISKNYVSGNEWSCKITKLTDTGPGAIRLNMTCSDYNLGLSINDPDPYEREFKEIMLLRKIDEKSMFVRKTLNGKFKGDWRAAYCPEETQRMYIELRAANKAEAEQKAAEEG